VIRTTKQRTAVAAALALSPEFISAQGLHARLGDAAPALATVYRTLQSLVDAGIADTVTRRGEQLYRACSTGHHHHLVCVSCGATTEIAGDEVEQWAERTGTTHGFRVLSHTADIQGICASCDT
jgi:Fur family ferric uptake transcriptional regulator